MARSITITTTMTTMKMEMDNGQKRAMENVESCVYGKYSQTLHFIFKAFFSNLKRRKAFTIVPCSAALRIQCPKLLSYDLCFFPSSWIFSLSLSLLLFPWVCFFLTKKKLTVSNLKYKPTMIDCQTFPLQWWCINFHFNLFFSVEERSWKRAETNGSLRDQLYMCEIHMMYVGCVCRRP